MTLLCRLRGHRPGRISGETGDLRALCRRCGASLVMEGHRDWRSVELARRGFSLRRALFGLAQALRCRIGRHGAAGRAARWVNLPSGEGYQLSECRHCSAPIARLPGQGWRRVSERELG